MVVVDYRGPALLRCHRLSFRFMRSLAVETWERLGLSVCLGRGFFGPRELLRNARRRTWGLSMNGTENWDRLCY